MTRASEAAGEGPAPPGDVYADQKQGGGPAELCMCRGDCWGGVTAQHCVSFANVV